MLPLTRGYVTTVNTLHRRGRFPRLHGALVSSCAATVALACGFGAPSDQWGSLTAASHPGEHLFASVVTEGPASVLKATNEPAVSVPGTEATDAALEAEIDRIIAAHPESRIGVAVVEISNSTAVVNDIQSNDDQSEGMRAGKIFEYGDTGDFVAASTAKVLAAAAYYDLVETGQASLDDLLGNYTAEFQLQAMLQQSNNDSWLLIMNAIGYTELTHYAASIGVDYDPTVNTLTPGDMAHVLANLYSGALLDAGNTTDLLASMQDTNYETLIPAATPADVTVFHKYGLLEGELHDAAILVRGEDAYALVIYTEGIDVSLDPERVNVFHDITQAVTDAVF